MTLDARVRGLETLETPRFSGARVRRTVAQSIANTTSTAVLFDAERFDTDNYHDLVSNTDRLTIPASGVYLVIANVRFAGNATGFRQVVLEVDGTKQIASITQLGSTATDQMMIVSGVWEFTAGQYVRCVVFQNSGGNLNINTGGAFSPEFAIALLG